MSHVTDTQSGQSADFGLTVVLMTVSAVFLARLFWEWLSGLNPREKARRGGLWLLNKAFGIDAKVRAGIAKLRLEVHKAKATPITPVFEKLPKLSDAEIKARLEAVLAEDGQREKLGREGGNYYFSAVDGHREFVQELAGRFLYTNVMHFDSARGALMTENELISFFQDLLHSPKDGVGTCTFGGSESIMLAMLSYRELGRKRGLADPDIVLFESAHVAFFKAAFYFGIRLTVVPCSHSTGEGDIEELLGKVSEGTVAVVLSGGTYAHGAVDAVWEANERLKHSDVWIHVDSCLGGFMSVCSAMRRDGFIPPIDFRQSRVGSISIDPHKYGEGPKGCSVLLFRNEELKKLSIYVKADWNGGLYATPSMPGSRSSAPVVGAWISLVRQGKEGLLRTYDEIVKAREALLKDLDSIPEVSIVGKCLSCVVSFGITKESGVDIFAVGEGLKDSKWHLSMMQRPFAFHITITRNNIGQLPALKADLVQAIAKARKNPSSGKKSMYGELYGSVVRLPDGRMIDDVLKTSIVEINRLKASE